MSRYHKWRPYVSVAKRQAEAAKEMKKLEKKGLVIQPVEISGRIIASSFWGQGWCDHMESFSDYENRLPRGRTYARNGSVCHLEIDKGKVEAFVSGSDLYKVEISIKPLAKVKWKRVKSACAGQIGSLLDLLRGKLSDGVMGVVADRSNGLFPLPGEIKIQCSCPDWASMCKHVAAVLYGVGARLDQSPEQLFVLRGVDHQELVDVGDAIEHATTSKGSSGRRLAGDSLADVFGIDLAEEGVGPRRPRKAKSSPEKITAKPTKRGKTAPQPSKNLKKSSSAALPESLTGTVIAEWRQSLNENLTEFAARLGVSSVCVSQWEKKGSKKIQPRERSLIALGQAWQQCNAPVKKAERRPFPKPLNGYAIRRWRESLNETQAEFGHRLGVSAACVCQWELKERRKVQPREDSLESLRRAWEDYGLGA